MAGNIKAARRAAGLTQMELAVALEVGPMTISRWERGLREPQPTNMAGLAEVLCRPVVWFFEDHGLTVAA